MIELERFRQHLQSLGPQSLHTDYLVAYSGGLDSHVLLFLCRQLELPVRAVHIHHGLQAQADAWSRHCETVCAQLGIECITLRVDAAAQAGESPEDAARRARYRAIETILRPGECLLSAHHANDQAETLLLQLMRGAGAAGLAAMPGCKRFGAGWHLRPLLVFSRDDILELARSAGLHWVEDPSNANTEIDRNLLRQTILPELHRRWPAVAQSISRSASLQQESLELIEALARIDLAAASTTAPRVLSIDSLLTLTRPRQLNVLRYWLRLHGDVPVTRKLLLQLLDSVITAASDADPVLKWGNSELRSYQGQLYLLPRCEEEFSALATDWDGRSRVQLGAHIVVRAETGRSPGLAMALQDARLSLRFRRQGETIQISGKRHHQSLKKLMQEARIPPWQRARIPLLYVDDELACVCGHWLADGFAAKPGAPGWLPVCEDSCLK